MREDRPEIEGFCFNELAYFPPETQNAMCASGMVFATEFRAFTADGRAAPFCGALIAASWFEAEAEAKRRNLGEKVVGQILTVGET